ncbi:MAG: TonB-dependent receptor [bacterium]|nr:TonB-dependent receptor [bacterium]
MKIFLITIHLFFSLALFGQKSDCHFVLKGVVIDSAENKPLSLTSIELVGNSTQVTSSDKTGHFVLTKLCQGEIELHVNHLQCEHIHISLKIYSDTTIFILLQHTNHAIEKVTYTAKAEQDNLERISLKKMDLQKGGSISELMQNIGGVTLLKTGGSISKPIVNGLHSNRVIILNNGIRQEGQNWGAEHAPEIDAFLASEIELLKGPEALRYAADGIGGVLMVKPPSVFNEKANVLKGEYNLIAATNGRGATASLILGSQLFKVHPIYWRIQGTLKRNGNLRTPNYFLANTGLSESNYSAAIGYQNQRLKFELFYSEFQTKIAIFKGAHVGNINDLLKAFQSDTPMYTSEFTYKIDRSYQQVKHQLFKSNGEWLIDSKSKIQFTVAYQKNHRQEYDILRSNNSFKGPDFDYYINTLTSDIAFLKTNLHKYKLITGLNGLYQANSFTGRFFVPGFYNRGAAAYFTTQRTFNKWQLELGLRYDYKSITAYLWNGLNLKVKQLSFNNATYAAQASYQTNKQLKFTFTSASSWRPPAPNELYSNGLHQGLATIEVGDSALHPERSYHNAMQMQYASKKLVVELELYQKFIFGFINLVPALPAQVTIRGAFPVYKYIQQDISMTGLNFATKIELKKFYFTKLSSNLLFASVLKTHDPLSQMPPLSGKITVGRNMKKYTYQLWCSGTAMQYRYVEGSDYVAPPKGFVLFGCDATYEFRIKNQLVKFNISVNNLLNTNYREYLNRFRYFANEPGFGLTARLIMPLNLDLQKNK